MFTSVFEKWLGMSRSHEDFRDSLFVLIAVSILSSVLVLFVYYNIAIVPNLVMASIEITGLVFCLLAYYFLWKGREVNLAANIMVSVMTSISLLLIYGTGHQEFALAFAFLTPIVSIFVLGYRVGSVFSLLNFAIVAYICVTGMDYWLPVYFDDISFIHLSAVYFFLFLTAFFYDSGRRKTMAMLKESNRQLQNLSHTDMLTQLYNRRHMEGHLKEVGRVNWVAILDIDDFKKINDEHGHDVGDRVLIKIARILSSKMDKFGHVGRWGGEEFLIAFEVAERAEVEAQIESIQSAISSYDFGIKRPVTLSCGIALHNNSVKSSTYRRADEALYQAKASGKNRYRMAAS